MGLRLHLALGGLSVSARLLAVVLPVSLAAQATRVLPLVLASGAPAGPTVTLVLSALGLLSVALAPPVVGVGVGLSLSRFVADGGARALASHGLGPASLARSLRPLALGVLALVTGLGVTAEPPLAAGARGALRVLGARALTGTLERGGQVEPVEGVVLAAPEGGRGGLYVARVRGRGRTETLTAEGFRVRVGAEVSVALSGVRAEREGGTWTARRVRVTLPLPEAPEEVMASDLAPGVRARSLGVARRHAARALWGVAGYAAVLVAAALALRPWKRSWTRLVAASVGPVAAAVSVARAGSYATERAQELASVWWLAAGVALGAMLAVEWAVRRVAPGRRAVL